MKPQGFVGISVVFPGVFHLSKQVVGTGFLENASDVGDFPAGVAVLLVATAAEITPETVGGEEIWGPVAGL